MGEARREAARRATMVGLVLLIATPKPASPSPVTRRAVPESLPRQVPSASTVDPGEPVIDEAYRFRLDNPGPGWKTVGAEEASKLSPGARALVFGPQDLRGMVFVDPLSASTLDGLVSMMTADGSRGELIERQDLEFLGLPAVRLHFRVTTPVTGKRVILMFVRDRWVYTLEFWHVGTQTIDPTRFFSALSLLPGEIVPEEPGLASDSRGIGWRVVDGVYESAISGIRVRPGENLRLVVGGELQLISDDAEVGLRGDDGLQVTFVPHGPRAGRSLDDLWRHELALRASMSLVPAEPRQLELDFLGSTRPIASWEQPPSQYYLGMFSTRTTVMWLIAWSAPGQELSDHEQLTRVAGLVTELDEHERAALEVELAALPDPQREVGASWSLNGARYLDFELGLIWSKPAPPLGERVWEFITGPRVRPWADGAEVVLVDRRGQGEVSLWRVPGVGSLDEPQWHEAIRARWPAVAGGQAETLEIDGATLQLFHGRGAYQGSDAPATVAVLRQGDESLEFLVNNLDPDPEQHARLARQALAALRLDPSLAPIATEGPRWIDRRMGVSLEPPAGWVLDSKTPAGFEEIGQGTTWKPAQGRAKLSLLSVYLRDLGQEPEWLLDFFEQDVRERYGKTLDDAPKRRTLEVDGRRARRLCWFQGLSQCFVVVDDGQVVHVFSFEDMSDSRVLDSVRFGAWPER
ncbi:MAG: hypothetical protein R6X02_24720 [Enhygromyxa sp.]